MGFKPITSRSCALSLWSPFPGMFALTQGYKKNAKSASFSLFLALKLVISSICFYGLRDLTFITMLMLSVDLSSLTSYVYLSQ
jgi:hypothetical protein